MSDLATAPSPAETKTLPSWHGSFIWYELMTSDQDAAIRFYTAVVGWNAADQTMADIDFRYTLLSVGQRPVAGLMELNAEMCESGGQPGWLGIVGVADVDEAVKSLVEAGGAQLRAPDDIPNIGRFAVVADSGGAVFQLMTPTPQGEEPAPLDPQALGGIGWHELYAGQGQQAAFAFYSGQFGWATDSEMDMGPMGKYRIFSKDGTPLGGMMDRPADMPVSAWAFYFNVDGIDAAIDRIKRQGGEVLMGPVEVPGGSWIVQAKDPQGAHFALVSPQR